MYTCQEMALPLYQNEFANFVHLNTIFPIFALFEYLTLMYLLFFHRLSYHFSLITKKEHFYKTCIQKLTSFATKESSLKINAILYSYRQILSPNAVTSYVSKSETCSLQVRKGKVSNIREVPKIPVIGLGLLPDLIRSSRGIEKEEIFSLCNSILPWFSVCSLCFTFFFLSLFSFPCLPVSHLNIFQNFILIYLQCF